MAKSKSLLGVKDLNFLERYLNTFSPTGMETAGQKEWLKYIKPYIDTYTVNSYGSVVGIINPKAKYKVVIEAHADEIAWMVNYVTDAGYIHVKRLGGSDHIIAPAKRVIIHTEKGPVRGVFGWPAIHTRRSGAKETTPLEKNLTVDVGAADSKEVEKLGIKIGDIISFDDPYELLNKKFFMGRALDNRMGGFMIAQVARLLKKNKKKLPYGLYIVNAVQEEVGLKGAGQVAHQIQPDVAIVTDVTHDTTTPMISKEIEGHMVAGNGPAVCIAPAVQRTLMKLIFDTAAQHKIPYQREPATRGTGTDTDAFAYGGKGAVSALISLPLKYMHTTVEMAHRDDVENTIKLIYQLLLEIKNNHDFRYFK